MWFTKAKKHDAYLLASVTGAAFGIILTFLLWNVSFNATNPSDPDGMVGYLTPLLVTAIMTGVGYLVGLLVYVIAKSISKQAIGCKKVCTITGSIYGLFSVPVAFFVLQAYIIPVLSPLAENGDTAAEVSVVPLIWPLAFMGIALGLLVACLEQNKK